MNRETRSRLPEWQALKRHAEKAVAWHLRELFAADPGRGKRFAIEAAGLHLDYSRQPLTAETLELLLALARACGLEAETGRLFAGEKINETEARPVLHWALRDLSGRRLEIDGLDVMPEVRRVRERMAAVAAQVRSQRWLGAGGKPVVHVVNLGIGGSDLGPRMACRALADHAQPGLHLHFAANLDPSDLAGILRTLPPEQTLFIVASKTFTTQETMANAAHARAWLLAHYGDETALAAHFIAVTARPQAALEFGIPAANVLEFWDWVGGRYSLASAIGLPLMIAVGPERFGEMLRGMEEMDGHFRSAPLAGNLPVLLALLGVWHVDFLGARTHAVLPYAQCLERFPAYLQQLEMESSGKGVDRSGAAVAYPTGPVIWGEPGTNGQHAFYQLLHQGTQAVPCDLIGFRRSLNPFADHHEQLLANMLAQGQALAFGRDRAELARQGVVAEQVPFRVFAGNRPSSTILADRLTPAALGRLIALYEHKVFVQGVIWNIFSFDQWGVELGKQLAGRLLPKVKGDAAADDEDSSTRALIEYFKKPV
jgi:glucose-6-phosphate isomerase